jgi:anti-anti-sigma regulatory factor
MADVPLLVVTIDWAAGVATVAVPGGLDSKIRARLAERLSWIMESRPRRLVLDLAGVADRFSEQVLAVVAAARQQLPQESLLYVRSASATVAMTWNWPTGAGYASAMRLRTSSRSGLVMAEGAADGQHASGRAGQDQGAASGLVDPGGPAG